MARSEAPFPNTIPACPARFHFTVTCFLKSLSGHSVKSNYSQAEYFFLFQTLAHVSGAQLNPAITVGLMVTGKVTLIRGVLYIAVQCIGAIAGSTVLQVRLRSHIYVNSKWVFYLAKEELEKNPYFGRKIDFLR